MEFEFEFEDDLDALRDIENDFPGTSRKSLDFSSPYVKNAPLKTKTPLTPSPDRRNTISLDDSFARPLLTTPEIAQETESESRKSQKRPATDWFPDSDDDINLQIDTELSPLPKPSRKRTKLTKAEQDDIDNFEITPPPSPDETQLILSRRNQKHPVKTSLPRPDIQDEDHRQYDYRPRILRRIPAGNYVSATDIEGQRVYLAVKTEDDLRREIKASFAVNQTSQLLGVPLADLRAQAEEERMNRLMIATRDRSLHRRDNEGNDMTISEEALDDEEEPENEDSLWVQYYSPQRYTHLLSDESTNRTLLKWLKLWDYVVFGREPKKAPSKEKKDSNSAGAGGAGGKKDGKWSNKGQIDILEELDQHNRPFHKVTLLCGPPGLGKTTLAHVIAKHGGYNGVEMNASDDRSVEIFKNRLESATQMKSVLAADQRPNCLIIDEIDGAPQPAINMLLAAIKAGAPEAGEKKKKKKNQSLLLRPIICICNDLYTPALKQLRQLALVLNFPPTLPNKLAHRLLEIAREERLKTDLTTLLALCEKTDNDIRSCVNTLQFVRSRGVELSLKTVKSMSLGQKDAHKSLFTVWDDIFRMPRPKRSRYVNPYDRGDRPSEAEIQEAAAAQNNMALSSRFQHTLFMVTAAGDQDKVTQGLHENFLNARIKDPHMDALLLAEDWLCFADHMNQLVARSQNYSLGRYNIYLPVLFHLLFATNAPAKIAYPRSQFETFTQLTKSQSLLDSLKSDMAPVVRKNFQPSVAVTEFLPMLLDLIQPTLRPVNTQLYSNREKQDMCQLVNVMLSYNLTYHQERTVEGQYTYTLDPNVDDLVRYTGLKPRRQLTYAAKQLIAREIELEKMRRAEPMTETPAVPVKDVVKRPVIPEKTPVTKPVVPNHKQTLQPKEIPMAERPEVDFFGRRVIRHSSVAITKHQKKEEEKKKGEIGGDIWFHFQEGFTNAVRKTVRMHDLM